MAAIESAEEQVLLGLLRAAVGKAENIHALLTDRQPDWERLLCLAQSHAVSAVLYDVLETCPDVPVDCMKRLQRETQEVVLANYRLLFLTSYLVAYLGRHGITAVTLKGAATAALYPVPEYRKSGDVDLLIPLEADRERALQLLLQAGFQTVGQQLALHHVSLKNAEGITVELHHTLTEPFDDQRVNQYLERLLAEYGRHIVKNKTWGLELTEPADAYHAFYLVLHMLQHFLREGFGLKNLCDWTLFWNREVGEEEKQRFLELLEQSGTGQFVRVLTAACVLQMGLSQEKAAFLQTETVPGELVQAFLKEVLEAGEFGRAQTDRMVAMRGSGVCAYVREFQHQMHLNFPEAGRVVVCWPFLWALTLARFLHNNRRLHRASLRSIIKKAGRRSVLVEQLRLFQ